MGGDLHLDQGRRDKLIGTARVLLPKKRNRADTVNAHTTLPNLEYPAGVMAPPFLESHKSTFKILRESDIVPAHVFPLPKAGGDHSVSQPRAGGGHNVPQHDKVTFKVAKQFMEAITFTKTPLLTISDEKYSMVDKARQLAIEAQD
jgi:hypothetical protein